jgi:hypothetical protein
MNEVKTKQTEPSEATASQPSDDFEAAVKRDIERIMQMHGTFGKMETTIASTFATVDYALRVATEELNSFLGYDYAYLIRKGE